MGVILQVALPSRVLAAARLQCGAAGAGASRGLGVCAEHARLAARGESARAMEIGDFLGRLGPGRFSQCERHRYLQTRQGTHRTVAVRYPQHREETKVSFLRRKTNNTQAPGLDTPRCVTLGGLYTAAERIQPAEQEQRPTTTPTTTPRRGAGARLHRFFAKVWRDSASISARICSFSDPWA